ncbi:MFS transporter-like protein [Lizonia empirigonia]|nr:MFS transporter-like protein [Lizonia empirigonia]
MATAHENHRLSTSDKHDVAHIEKVASPLATSTDIIEDPALEARLNHKFDLHILPWLFGIWLFSFIDRSNIGNANIAGLSTELHLEGTQYNIALLIFYIPYIIADVPSNWLVKRFRAGVYLPTLVTSWGLVCTFMGFTKSFAGLVVCRALLGLFEGGILGGVIVYLAFFYRRHQMLLRSGLFYCAAPLSGAFGGLLAIEGAATVAFGCICYFFMPDTPAMARFLDDEEKDWALRCMRLDAHGATDVDVNEEKFDWYWVKMALKAPQTYFNGFIWFFLLIPLYSFSLFLPSIIAGMGYHSTTAQLLTVPPNMAALFTVLACAYFSDRLKTRGAFIAGGTIVGAVGYIMLIAAQNNATRYAGTFLIAIGVFQGSPMVIGWTSNNLAPHYVRATGVGVISIANCSAFTGTFIYLKKDAPYYTLGHSVCLGAMAYLRWENRKRERGERSARLSGGEVWRLGHRHPEFRYTL